MTKTEFEDKSWQKYGMTVTVYADNTPFLTEKEIEEDNLFDMFVPLDLLYKWCEQTGIEHPAQWLFNESTADGFDGLYDFCVANGYTPERFQKGNYVQITDVNKTF